MHAIRICKFHFTLWNIIIHGASIVSGMNRISEATYLCFWSNLTSFSASEFLYPNSHAAMASKLRISKQSFQLLHLLLHWAPAFVCYRKITCRGAGIVASILHLAWGIAVSGKSLRPDNIYVRVEDWTLLWCISMLTPSVVEFILYENRVG
jgi:hypothetical protein